MKRVKKAPKKPTGAVRRRVRQLERRAHQRDVEADEERGKLWRTQRDVEFLGGEVRRHDEILNDQSRRIDSVEDRQWWNENPF